MASTQQRVFRQEQLDQLKLYPAVGRFVFVKDLPGFGHAGFTVKALNHKDQTVILENDDVLGSGELLCVGMANLVVPSHRVGDMFLDGDAIWTIKSISYNHGPLLYCGSSDSATSKAKSIEDGRLIVSLKINCEELRHFCHGTWLFFVNLETIAGRNTSGT
jgi:hypothetical protein